MEAGVGSSRGSGPRDHGRPGAPSWPSSPQQLLHALIVEDDPGDALLAQKMLTRADQWSWSVQLVERLSTAEEVLCRDSNQIDLVILDMRLPDGDGLDALARLLALRPDVAIVILTGLDNESLARACLEAGAIDYVQKSEMLGRGFARTVGYALARARNKELKTQLDGVSRLAALGEVAASVAHEINNPVMYAGYNIVEVGDSLRAIRDGLSGEDSELALELVRLTEVLDVAGEGIERIGTVVRALQDHVSMNRTQETHVTDPVSVARSSLTLIDYQVRHWASVETNFAACPPIAIHPHRFGQLVTNLVLNAARAVRDHASPQPVQVSLYVEDGAVVLQVRDEGVGIPAAELPRIFESFYTSRPTRGGTGLGLSIVREIVASVDGRVEVESEEGAGSLFSVHIPLAEGLPSRVAPVRAQGVSARRRVLLIDDDELVLSALVRGLERHHEVRVASGGTAALELLESLGGEIDVILCDLTMPELDGQKTLLGLFEHSPHLRERAAILSGGATSASLRSFLAETTLPIIDKPASLPTILSVIESMFGPTSVEPGPGN